MAMQIISLYRNCNCDHRKAVDYHPIDIASFPNSVYINKFISAILSAYKCAILCILFLSGCKYLIDFLINS